MKRHARDNTRPRLAACFWVGVLALAPLARASQDAVPIPDPQPQPHPQPDPEPQPAPVTLGDLLRDGSEAERARAARAALSVETDEPTRKAVEDALARGVSDPTTHELLRAAARAPSLPAWFERSLLALASAAPDADTAPIARALASARTRDAARALLTIAERVAAPEPRAAAIDALVTLSGRDDLGPDTAAWRRWLDDAAAWDETRWLRELSWGQAARAERLAASRGGAVRRLVESLRQVHLATPAAERSALLAGMLRDDLDEVRRLGVELVGRELEAGQRPDQTVELAAIALLGHQDATVRAEGARLLGQLVPDNAAGAVAIALAREHDPRAAAAMLRLASRWPGAALLEASASWLESPRARADRASWPTPWIRQARAAAIDACWALFRAGYLYHPDQRARVLRALREIPLAELTPAGCMLRVSLGSADDRDQIRTLLRGPDPALRIAAGEALVAFPRHLDTIIDAAAHDPQLIDVAARGVVLHRQTGDGFSRLADLPFASPQDRRSTLSSVAAMIPAPDVLRAAERVAPDMPLQESVLSVLPRTERIISERADPANLAAIAEGLVRLADLRLRIGRPAEAVAALDALPDIDTVRGSPDEARRLRTIGFVLLNRLDEAEALAPSPEDFLAALEAAADLPHAETVGKRVLARAEPDMTDGQRERLSRVLAEIARAKDPRPAPPSPN
ncbi:MAG: hypothetical protein HRU70_02620 [Phycisphaeraceae bacterium]|nr:MAG: hypothetical protein HRU70_02620 [Phycisphaeraceae bacterium]